MIADRSLVIYACVSRGTTILAEFTTGDPDLDAIALKCIENVPQFHAVFSHAARGRTYTFLINDPFVYFGIFGENLGKARGMWFLDGVRAAFRKILEKDSNKISDNLTTYRFQGELNPIFHDLLAPPLGSSNSPPSMEPLWKDSRNVSMDSSTGSKVVSVPLLGKPGKGLKKKRRLMGENNGALRKDTVGDNKVVEVDGGCVSTRDFSATSQRAKQKWRQQVVVVLTVDLAVCCLLFGIWLGICRGFKCING